MTRILRSYYENKEDVDETRHKFRIIEAAARLLKSDIKSQVSSDSDVYLSTSDIDVEKSLQYLPDSVRLYAANFLLKRTLGQKICH